jgi:septal ring factor EnvC (AmiA/AmiB activator)
MHHQSGAAEAKNEDLVRDIKEMNRIARKAEMEKQMVVTQADRELEQAKYEIARSRDELNSMDSAVHQLEVERHGLTAELVALRAELDRKRTECCQLNELVERIQDDKCKLAKKIAKYLENGKSDLSFFF